MNEITAIMPSNKKFGWVFSGITAFSCAYFYWKMNEMASLSLGAVSTLFLLFTAIAPNVLGPLNKLWFKLGLFLGKIVSPVVLGIIFFIVISPASICMRIFGRDALLMKKRQVTSYWINREPAGLDEFKNQF